MTGEQHPNGTPDDSTPHRGGSFLRREAAGSQPVAPPICKAAELLEGIHVQRSKLTAAQLDVRQTVPRARVIENFPENAIFRRASQIVARHPDGQWKRLREDGTTYHPCETCLGAVAVSPDGLHVIGCEISRGCEKQWADMHPDLYNPNSKNPDATHRPVPAVLPCGEELCGALVRVLNSKGRPVREVQTFRSSCGVEAAGKGWKERGERAFGKPIEVGRINEMPVYDGEVVTPQDIRAIESRLGISGEQTPLPPDVL